MPLQCPLPENINPLSPNGFMFAIEKLPELSYFCQSISIPPITLPVSEQASPFSDARVPGDKLEFSELTVKFLIDENMKNYTGVFNWIQALGFPENNQQYSDFLDSQANMLSELAKGFSDGTLTILGSNFAPVKTFKFIDLTPINISVPEFSTTNQEVQYLAAEATFGYSYYTIE